jgi:phosphoenolpyruvate-protein phosphotransferase/dihydroxyacetone kinase phosphotransfer subunit
MVGIVIVSHSAKLAEGVAELAREMGGPDVPLEVAGGTDMPDEALGTDATKVQRAIEQAQSGDGVLVLMDLGSAVLSAEMALEMLSDDHRGHVLLCEAPLIEGAVAAATAAKLGMSLDEVAGEARGGLQPKVAHLGTSTPGDESPQREAPETQDADATTELDVGNRLGLHARPAARFVQTAGPFDAQVWVTNLSTGAGPASARSLNAIATLGVRRGHRIAVSARGPQANAALEALEALARQNFGDADGEGSVAPAPTVTSEPAPAGALRGLPAAPGIASGQARRLQRAAPDLPNHRTDDPEKEWAALQEALEKTRREILQTRREAAARLGEEHASIFDAHLLLLDDETLTEPARRSIFDDNRNAAHAYGNAASAIVERYRSLDDEYQAARADDLSAIADQVVSALTGRDAALVTLAEAGIVVADDLTPAQTVGLDADRARGIVTASGGPTAHSAILARALGIPAVVGIGESVLDVPDGSVLIVDGTAGLVYVDPPQDVLNDYNKRAVALATAAHAAQRSAKLPAVTTDGRRIEVVANIGSLDDVSAALESGAEGVGLLRTEFLFLERETPPTEQEHFEAYEEICRSLEGRPVIIRTLDAGADKPIPYMRHAEEANPFLGARGVRLALLEERLFVAQLRAILRVAADWPVKVMFPMVSTVDELHAARAILDRERRSLGTVMPDTGIMVEVPGAAIMADSFAREVDFFSIGTNDLSQYVMAAERTNSRVAALADAMHPAVLRIMQNVAVAAEEAGKWVGVCGELAGDPAGALILVGLGIKELSMSPPAIPGVKAAIRATTYEGTRDLARRALGGDSPAAVRRLFEQHEVGRGTVARGAPA